MATIIWCDHVKHVVAESRSDVAKIIGNVLEPELPESVEPAGFAYFTVSVQGELYQRALNVALISSFEAKPGDAL